MLTLSTDRVRYPHARRRHQRKQVETALRHAEDAGCTVTVVHHGHVWGRVESPNGQRLPLWSTPRNADAMAQRIREFVRKHT